MLDVAMTFLRDQLQAFIVARRGALGGAPGVVNLTRIVNDLGRFAFAIDSLGLTVINIEEERVFKEQLPSYVSIEGRQVAREPEVRINLHVLVAANFQLYDEGLRFI